MGHVPRYAVLALVSDVIFLHLAGASWGQEASLRALAGAEGLVVGLAEVEVEVGPVDCPPSL